MAERRGALISQLRGRRRTDWVALGGGVLVLGLLIGALPLIHLAKSAPIGLIAFVLLIAAVGLLVALRQPRNPLGWVLLAAGVCFAATGNGSLYTVLDYRMRHGALPLGPVAVILQQLWAPALSLMGVAVLLFPDARLPSRRLRWVLYAFVACGVAFTLGAMVVAGYSIATGHIRIEPGGDLYLIDHPTGAWRWWQVTEKIFFPSYGLCFLFSVIGQFLAYRRASGPRRLQLKWLMLGGAGCAVAIVLSFSLGSNPSPVLRWIGNHSSVLLAALPVSIGIGILRYRLFDIDRLISRTLSYVVLTGLLVGGYVGLVTLTTRALPLSSPVGVAISTLAAAAAFAPLRRRVQRLVDRRFNRARYDRDATVADYASRLRGAVDLDTVRDDLLEVVNRTLEPGHVSLWLKPRT